MWLRRLLDEPARWPRPGSWPALPDPVDASGQSGADLGLPLFDGDEGQGLDRNREPQRASELQVRVQVLESGLAGASVVTVLDRHGGRGPRGLHDAPEVPGVAERLSRLLER